MIPGSQHPEQGQGSPWLGSEGGWVEGEGSRVTSLACSCIPREAEEPGKETEHRPPPSLRPLGLGERLPAQTAPVPGLGTP